MRVLVYPHSMEIGGSQINAVELAAAVAGRGHEVCVFGPPGPLWDTARDLGLPCVQAPAPGRRPSPRTMAALDHAVRERGVEVVHAYEWPPVMESALGPHLCRGTATVASVMSMGVAPFLPSHLPLVVGTRLIADSVRARSGPVHVVEPPVDTRQNRPLADDGAARARWGLERTDLVVVVVSRLAEQLKREGLLAAVDAVGRLAAEMPVRLLVVGDGPVRGELSARADAVNARAGRDVVVMAGAVLDPRPAYGLADVVLGMGSSVLRGMAFGKPAVVQGERGYWRPLTPQTLPEFRYQGWYGLGTGQGGAVLLEDILRGLARDLDRRKQLGAFARGVVEEEYSLQSAARRIEGVYQAVLEAGPSRARRLAPVARATVALGGYKVERRLGRLLGAVPEEDFNAPQAQPTAASALLRSGA